MMTNNCCYSGNSLELAGNSDNNKTNFLVDTMKRIGNVSAFLTQQLYPLVIDGKQLLLINRNPNFYLVENKCGHFGIPLQTGCIEGEEIICSGHGISFSLETGEIVNRPYETCDPIRTYEVVVQDEILFFVES
jgi:nitrite reductase/ring-hydroxylating ferredoxin subunit